MEHTDESGSGGEVEVEVAHNETAVTEAAELNHGEQAAETSIDGGSADRSTREFSTRTPHPKIGAAAHRGSDQCTTTSAPDYTNVRTQGMARERTCAVFTRSINSTAAATVRTISGSI